MLVGLRIENSFLGVFWIEPQPLSGTDNHELLQFIASQAAALIRRHCSTTLDLATGLQSRGFWKQMACRDLRSSFRFHQPVSIATIGLLRMETISEIGWDAVLDAVGRVVQISIRGTDLAMRESDEQITIMLPHTDAEGARRFGELLTSRISDLDIPLPEGSVQIEAVAGSATFDPQTIPAAWSRTPVPVGYFERAESLLLERASSLLSAAVEKGPGSSLVSETMEWPQD